MSEKTIAVIGAGPAGLTAAYQLALKGIRVKVYEAGVSVGGMAKPEAMISKPACSSSRHDLLDLLRGETCQSWGIEKRNLTA